MKEKWLKAGLHSNGGGLEQGEPSFQAFADAKKFLLQNGKTQAASLLWKAVAGGAPIGERLQLTPDAELAELRKLHGTDTMDAQP